MAGGQLAYGLSLALFVQSSQSESNTHYGKGIHVLWIGVFFYVIAALVAVVGITSAIIGANDAYTRRCFWIAIMFSFLGIIFVNASYTVRLK